MAQQNLPPQWGRSFRQQAPNMAATLQQLVRAKLATPRDFTVYLRGQDSNVVIGGGFDGAAQIATNYRVSIGAGGVALEQGNVYAPAVGVARHYVSEVVDVDVELLTPTSSAILSRGVSAVATLGRPTVSYRLGSALITSNVTALPPTSAINAASRSNVFEGWVSNAAVNNTYLWFAVPAFTTRARLHWGGLVGATAADIAVQQTNWAGNTVTEGPPSPSPIAPAQIATDFADWQELAPQTTFIRVNFAVGSGRVAVSFERML